MASILDRPDAEGLNSIAATIAFEQAPLDDRIGPRDSYAVILDAARRYGDIDALVMLADAEDRIGRKLTYRELARQVTQAANLFHSLGARRDDAIAFLLPNLIETHVVMWGAEACGIASPVNPFLREDQIADILNAGAATVLAAEAPLSSSDAQWAKVCAVARSVPTLAAIVLVGAGGQHDLATLSKQAGCRVVPLGDADGQPDDGLISQRVIDAGDLAAYFHTGGTTGTPKLAMQTHFNQAFTAWALGAGMTMTPGDRVFCGLPLFHVNGAMITGLHPFRFGQTIFILTARGYRDPAVIGNFWRIVEAFRPVTFSGVPTIFAALSAVDPGDADLSSLTHALSGAAPLPAELLRRFEARTGVAIAEGYGLTEGSCVSTGNPIRGEKRAGSVGIRLPYTGLRISADGGRTAITDGTSGPVLIAGPNLFRGYKDRATGGPNGLGWFDTGDLGRIDEDGYLWLTGRSKDLIIRGGHNIDPGVIEEALLRHPAVALAAAIGQPDRHIGELPVAYVALRPGAVVAPEALIEHSRAVIAERAAVPVRVEIVDPMPVTAVGKIYKVALRYLAIRHALHTVLSEAAVVDPEITVIEDKLAGTVVTIATAAGDVAKARTALEGFALNYGFETKEERS